MNVSYKTLAATRGGIKIKVNFFSYFVATSFFLNETVRSMVDQQWGSINFLFLLGIMVLVGYSLAKNRIRPLPFFIACFFSALTMINTIVMHKPLLYMGMTVANLLAPLFLVSVKLQREKTIALLRTFVKMLNVLIVTLLILGVADYLTHGAIQLTLARTVYAQSGYSQLIASEYSLGIYRYYSIIGHPLTNAKYFLIFFLTNNIYARFQGKYLMNKHLVSFILIAGLVISGSKTGLVLGVILLLFFSGIKRNNMLYYFGIIGAALLFLNTTLFQQNLKLRFLEGVQSGDISTGRNPMLQLLWDSDYRPDFILGGGADFSREVAMWLNGSIFNFEYPVIMLAFDYGIVGVLMIYFCILLYPAFVFLRKKQFYILFGFVILSIMINTNSALANLGHDSVVQICFLLMLVLNLQRSSNQAEASET